MQIQEFRPSESGRKLKDVPGLFAYRYKQKCLGLAILGILRLSEMDTNSILYLLQSPIPQTMPAIPRQQRRKISDLPPDAIERDSYGPINKILS